MTDQYALRMIVGRYTGDKMKAIFISLKDMETKEGKRNEEERIKTD